MIGANIVLIAAVIAGHTELAAARGVRGMTAVHRRFGATRCGPICAP